MSKYDKNSNIVGYVYTALAIILIFGTYFFSGSDPVNSTNILKSHGYSNIKCEGYSWFLGDRELNRTKFTATSPNGENVVGAVCYSFRPLNADIIIKGN